MSHVTADTALFCPKCASPSVEYSLLEGSFGRCLSCGWNGEKRELLASPFTHTTSINNDELVQRFERDVRNAIAKDLSLSVARLLQSWGFLYGDQRVQGILLGRYMRAIGKAVILSVLDVRKQIEAERAESQKEKNDVG